MKVRLVRKDDDKFPETFEKNLAEWESKDKVIEAETEAEVIPEELDVEEEIQSVLVDAEFVAPRVIEEEKFVDITMVGDVLRFSIQNTTSGVWRKCYPAAFWMRDGKRLADPATKGQCVGDIRPGMTYPFVVVIPKFPLGDKPNLLRVAILEDGVGWHTVEDLKVR